MSSLGRLSAIRSHLAQAIPATSFRTTTPSFKLGSYLSSRLSSEMSASVKQMVDQAIAENDVVVFSKTWCSYSAKAKRILSEATKKDVKVVELDETDEESQIQAYLKQLNGQGTVPHIYIKQQFIGGCSDLQKLPGNELQKRIAA